MLGPIDTGARVPSRCLEAIHLPFMHPRGMSMQFTEVFRNAGAKENVLEIDNKAIGCAKK